MLQSELQDTLGHAVKQTVMTTNHREECGGKYQLEFLLSRGVSHGLREPIYELILMNGLVFEF